MKIIAYHLPQFHSFLENEQFWGEGFTEWTNVTNAKSYGDWHILKYPHPDIGYYCLLDKDARKKQAQLAKKYNVYGFCYYHYWFGGKVLMQKPLELMLHDGEPNLPFCLSWANESWKAWMWGGKGKTLVAENYGREEEWKQHLEYLLKYFRHPNYICIDNQPVLVIYNLPRIKYFNERFQFWKKELKSHGFDGLFVTMTLGPPYEPNSIIPDIVDATVEFFPNWMRRKTGRIRVEKNSDIQTHNIYDMEIAYQLILNYPKLHKRQFRGIMTGFDSSPRNALNANTFINGSPAKYQKALYQQIQRSTEDFIFVNAWNEWGEQAMLEPNDKDGYGYLEATKNAIGRRIFI